MKQFLKSIFENQYASGVILTVIGALIGIIVSRITGKLSIVTYSVSTSKLGETADNNIHGKIEVHHKERLLPNFYFSKIKIFNPSNNDLENVKLTFFVRQGVLILSDFIKYENAVCSIPYSQEYQSMIQNQNYDLFSTIREYNIPVLNRGQSISLELTLTHGPELKFPIISASMVHKGAKLIESYYSAHFHGVPTTRTLPWAIILGIVLYLAIPLFIINPWVVGIAMLLYGFFAQSVAAFIIKVCDKIGEKIGILPPKI